MVINNSPHSLNHKVDHWKLDEATGKYVDPNPPPRPKPISFRERALKVEKRLKAGEQVRRSGKRFVWDKTDAAFSSAMAERLIDLGVLRPVKASGLFDDRHTAQLYTLGLVAVAEALPLKARKPKRGAAK